MSLLQTASLTEMKPQLIVLSPSKVNRDGHGSASVWLKKRPGVKGEMDRFINGGGLCLVAAAIELK